MQMSGPHVDRDELPAFVSANRNDRIRHDALLLLAQNVCVLRHQPTAMALQSGIPRYKPPLPTTHMIPSSGLMSRQVRCIATKRNQQHTNLVETITQTSRYNGFSGGDR
jgi:hypothetical protein